MGCNDCGFLAFLMYDKRARRCFLDNLLMLLVPDDGVEPGAKHNSWTEHGIR